MLSAGSTSFSYQAMVDLTAPIGTSLNNGIDLVWGSIAGANGDPDNGRNGEDGIGLLNDYTDSDSASVTTNADAAIDATKTVADLNAGVLFPGDILEYTVTLENLNGTLSGVVFSDLIPSNATYLPGSIVFGGVAQTDALDGDNADFDVSSANSVTVDIGEWWEAR